MSLPSSLFYSTKEVAAIYGIASKTVTPWVNQKLIPEPAIDNGRMRRWHKKVINEHCAKLCGAIEDQLQA
jgi:predicted site-specific integrase-resolvase